MADEVLHQGVRGITDIIINSEEINLDFADIKTVLQDKGIAHFGIGYGQGENKCEDAIKQAIHSPLLETTVDGASDVIINMSGDFSLIEAAEASAIIYEMADADSNIIYGYNNDDKSEDSVVITVIATGLENNETAQVMRNPAMGIVDRSSGLRGVTGRQGASGTLSGTQAGGSMPAGINSQPVTTRSNPSVPVGFSGGTSGGQSSDDSGGIKVPEFIKNYGENRGNRNNRK
jgi:cell division protein FtsZ